MPKVSAATSIELTAVPAVPKATAASTRALEQLVWDLHFGVTPRAEVADVEVLVDDAILSRIRALAGPTERVVAGHDVYPVSIQVHGARDDALSIDERVSAYEREARLWFDRYRRPFWVAETSNLGLDVTDGPRWLDRLVATLDRLRADGLPARGLCWYSRGDQFDWHTMLTRPIGEVTEVGLFDAARVARPVAASVGRLAAQRSSAG